MQPQEAEHLSFRLGERVERRHVLGLEDAMRSERPDDSGEIEDDNGNEQTLQQLRNQDRIIFRYTTPDGQITREANPNGAIDNIAGILLTFLRHTILTN